MKKANNVKWFTMGIAVCLLISAFIVPALAASFTKTATLAYNNIKITLNGQAITPKDVDGNTVDPFIIDGTTYLPVRGISNALNIAVDWDANNNTVVLDYYAHQYSQLQNCYVKLDDAYDDLVRAHDESRLYYKCVMNGSPAEDIKNYHSEFISDMLSSGGIIETAILNAKNEISLIDNQGDADIIQEIAKANTLCDEMIESLNYLRLISVAIYRIEDGYSDGYQMYIDNDANAITSIMENDTSVTQRLSDVSMKLIDITK